MTRYLRLTGLMAILCFCHATEAGTSEAGVHETGVHGLVAREMAVQQGFVEAMYPRDRIMHQGRIVTSSTMRRDQHRRQRLHYFNKDQIFMYLDLRDDPAGFWEATRPFIDKTDLDGFNEAVRQILDTLPEQSHPRFITVGVSLDILDTRIRPKLERTDPAAMSRFHESTLPFWREFLAYRFDSDPEGLPSLLIWQMDPLIESIQIESLRRHSQDGLPPSLRKEWATLLLGYLGQIDEIRTDASKVASYLENHGNHRELLRAMKHLSNKKTAFLSHYRTIQAEYPDVPELYDEMLLPLLVEYRTHDRAKRTSSFLGSLVESRIIRTLTQPYRTAPDALPELHALLDASGLPQDLVERIRRDAILETAPAKESPPKSDAPAVAEPPVPADAEPVASTPTTGTEAEKPVEKGKETASTQPKDVADAKRPTSEDSMEEIMREEMRTMREQMREALEHMEAKGKELEDRFRSRAEAIRKEKAQAQEDAPPE